MSVGPTDLLFWAGGDCYERFGVACRKVASIKYRGEELKETFTRADAATVASYVDRDGFIRRALANVLRPTWITGDWDFTGTTRKGACLLLEKASTNLLSWSEALSNWTDFNTPITTDAAATFGILSFAKIEDNDAALFEYKQITVTFTGDAVKAISFWLAQPDVAPASGNGIRVRDTTAAADRLTVDITWSAGVPTANVITGTQIQAPEFVGLTGSGKRVYRFRYATTAVTAANTNQVRLTPSALATETGDMYCGGVQAEDSTYPTSYIRTAGATATRAADRLEFPFLHGPEAMTVYAHFIERAQPNWVSIGSAPRIMQIGGSAGSDPRLYLVKSAGTDIYDFGHDPATQTDATLDLNALYGDRIELRGVLNADGSVALSGAKNGGAESTGTPGSAQALAAAWSSPSLVSLGCIGASGQGDIALRSLKVARGTHTLAALRTP